MTCSSGKVVSRRSLIKGVGATLVLASTRSHAKPTDYITVADPGYEAGFRKAFYDPFEKQTGIKVVSVARNSEPTAQFKAMVETRSYIWDVCDLTLSARDILAKEGLLEPIDLSADQVPGLMAGALSSTWFGNNVYSTVLAYRTDRLNPGPRSWADYWDVKTFPGRRALRKNPIDTLEQALLADGVALDKLYPLDVGRAFKSLDRIKPHISAWWSGGAQSVQLLQSGEVDMAAMWNARAQTVVDGGVPVEIVWNQGLYSIEGWSIPKGCPKVEAARAFVKFCAQPARQAAYTELLAYGPTIQSAYDFIPPGRAKVLPTFPPNLMQMAMAREDWWSANRSQMNEKFEAWILS